MSRQPETFARGGPVRSAHRRGLLIPLLALLVVCGAIALAVQATVRPAPRTLTLEARGMSFYLAGDPAPNPRLTVSSGETVKLVLRNEDAGMAHDVAVPSFDGVRMATRPLRHAGESAEITFRAPGAPGDYAYVCTFHSRMMRGVLEVR